MTLLFRDPITRMLRPRRVSTFLSLSYVTGTVSRLTSAYIAASFSSTTHQSSTSQRLVLSPNFRALAFFIDHDASYRVPKHQHIYSHVYITGPSTWSKLTVWHMRSSNISSGKGGGCDEPCCWCLSIVFEHDINTWTCVYTATYILYCSFHVILAEAHNVVIRKQSLPVLPYHKRAKLGWTARGWREKLYP
jgi:hypothetical protein